MKIINKKKQASKASKKKTNKKVPKTLKTPKLNTNLVLAKTQKNTPAYYGCLAEKARKGNLTGRITTCCKECKEKGTELTLNRKKEIKTLALAYKQLGLSITELIKH